jgi:integrase
MATGLISKRSVDALQPATKDQYLWDEEVSGFGLKVTPKGARVYLLQYRMGGRGSPTRRFTIGKHGVWTPDEAKKEARKLRQLVDTGTDPQQAQVDRLRAQAERKRQEEVLGFGSYADRFLKEYGIAEWRPGTYKNVEAIFRGHVKPKLGPLSLLSIERSDITAMLDSIPREKQALRRSAYAYTRKLFGWAVSRGDLDKSPMDGMKPPAAVADRERVLKDGELRLVWLASEQVNGLFGHLVRLLALTGQRRDEVAGMSWQELDRGAHLWTIPGARTKNGLEQLVPLSGAAMAELDALAGQKGFGEDERAWPRKGFVISKNGVRPFSGFSKCKLAIDAAMKDIASNSLDTESDDWRDWRLHDLRRTLTTGMQRLGIRFEVTESVLNHSSGSKAGVAGVYQRHDWKTEKRLALMAWARHVEKLISPNSNIVQLASHRA